MWADLDENFELVTERLRLRRLKPASDNFSDYLNGMRNTKNSPFILSTRSDFKLDELESFVNETNSDPNYLLLGIFQYSSQKHIGNIKFHVSNCDSTRAEIGIFIWDLEHRSKGFGSESILVCMNFLRKTHGIREFWLGVHADNITAISTYSRIGFRNVFFNQDTNTFTMELIGIDEAKDFLYSPWDF
jgi:RimJ/RimL family protein N-acetyltransferase